MIRLRFTKDRTFLAPVIRWYEGCEWDHVEIDVGYGYLGARPDGGVLVRDKHYIKPIAEAFATIDMSGTTAGGIHFDMTGPALHFCYDKIGEPYDWSAIFGFAFDRNWHESGRWICSELVAAALLSAGKPLLNPDTKVWRISPRDIALSPFVKFE